MKRFGYVLMALNFIMAGFNIMLVIAMMLTEVTANTYLLAGIAALNIFAGVQMKRATDALE